MSLKEFFNQPSLVVIGGGAAGIFAAIAAKETHPDAHIILLEKSAVLLSKVRISGGGRCNVTHACFDPYILTRHYPRGHKELLGPFHRFQPRDTIAWFEKRGVQLKTEADGRMFPVTDTSQTIIDCLLNTAKNLGVDIHIKKRIDHIEIRDEGFNIFFTEAEPLFTKKLLLATGASREGHLLAKQMGHTIQEPIASLFTFNIPDSPLAHLSGIALTAAQVIIEEAKLSQTGPLLITHFGFSGPAVLKLSAWGAHFLHRCHYHTSVTINWLPNYKEEALFQCLRTSKSTHPHQTACATNPFHLPKNLWLTLLGEIAHQKWMTLTDKQLRILAHQLHQDVYLMSGKTTHKEEFVTCGGVTLNEIDFKTLQSKICPGLFFAGEILDIDGVTGGFNFQNAWTTGYIAGTSSCS